MESATIADRQILPVDGKMAKQAKSLGRELVGKSPRVPRPGAHPSRQANRCSNDSTFSKMVRNAESVLGPNVNTHYVTLVFDDGQ